MKTNKKLLMILVNTLLLVSLVACSNANIKNLPNFRIESIEESHIGSTKRYAYHVVVDGKPNKSDLLEISKEVIEKAKKETPFNALMIGFYDYPEYIDNGFALGKIEYVPNGNWVDAMEVKTGDYKTMELVDFLQEKDWSLQLTPEEVKCWHLWNESYFYEANLKGDDFWKQEDPESEITKNVASELDLSVEEVNTIIDKQLKWMMSDLE